MAGDILMDFEFFQFQQEDYHDVKRLTTKYLDGEPFEVEQLSEELIEQFYVGSMIKIEGTIEPVGFLTALNIVTHAAKPCIQSITKFLLSHLKNKEESAFLQSFLEGDKGNVSLVFSERIESVPVMLAPHLYSQLHEEIERAFQTEKVRQSTANNLQLTRRGEGRQPERVRVRH
jgi:hypothetical protein